MSIASNETHDAYIKRLASKMARAHARKSEAEDELKAIKAELAEALGEDFHPGTKITTAEGIVVASVRMSARRFDVMKASTILPQAVIDLISTKQIDPKVAKLKLDESIYDQCLTDGKPTIVSK
jgi:hypothetical protein